MNRIDSGYRLVILSCAYAALCAQPPLGQGPGARDMFFGGLDVPSTGTSKSTPAAAPKRTAVKALGLRYSIVRLQGENREEVPVSTRFRSGDRIQLKLEGNQDGYLYLVSQGSSGAWKSLFPRAGSRAGVNRVKAGQVHISTFRFDSTPGTERLFVVLSRAPEKDLDALLFQLQKEAMVGNQLVAQIRMTHSRDMVLEDAGEGNDRGVYAVNRTGSAGGRVVVDISLLHE